MAGDLMASGCMDGRMSAMSECGAQAMEDAQGRRMSDPVRPLDRNFGVGGQLSRHRSFSNLQGAPGAGRIPLHGQRVQGQNNFMGGVDQGMVPPQAGQAHQQFMNQVSFSKGYHSMR